MSQQPSNEGNQDRATVSEKLVALSGALLLLGAIGILLFYAIRAGDGPPDLQVRVEHIQRLGDRYLVEIATRNEGGETAAAVQVAGRLTGQGKTEKSQATFDYIPPRSESQGGLFFKQDPREGTLEFEIGGYQRP